MFRLLVMIVFVLASPLAARDLTRDEIVYLIPGRIAVWGQGDARVVARFDASGMAFFEQGASGLSGEWRIAQDGRVCWTHSGFTSGCFRFREVSGRVHVAREDERSREDLGPAQIYDP